MPLVRIDLLGGKALEYREHVGRVVYDAMTEALGVPNAGRMHMAAVTVAE